MKKRLLALGLLFPFFSISAQEKIEFINTKEVITQGFLEGEEGNLDKALVLFNKVNKNDSLYHTLSVTKSYFLLNNDRNDEAIQILNESLRSDYYGDRASFFVNKANALSNKKDYTKALRSIENGLKEYPKNSSLYHNKGLILEKQEKIDQAIEAYQMAILLDPSYNKPHLALGNLYYKQEKVAQAMMCYNTSLLLNPDGEDSFHILQVLNEISKTKNKNTSDPKIIKQLGDEDFEDINLIISNRVALNDSYEIDSKIQVPLTKQNHALITYLKDHPSQDGFFNQVYVPIFKWISQEDNFELFTYTVSYSIQNENYRKFLDKQFEDVVEFVSAFRNKWQNILYDYSTKISNDDKSFYYSDMSLIAEGKIIDKEPSGKWIFYNENGKKSSEGLFDKNGKKTGLWQWYYPNNQLKETSELEDGEINGKNVGFFENGRKKYSSNYKNGKLNGEFLLYNEQGALIQKKYFKDGELDQTYTSYFDVGESLPEFVVPYKNKKVNGEVIEYYATGKPYSVMQFKDGEKNGVQKNYLPKSLISSETNFKENLPVGEFVAYHPNGKKKQTGTYNEDGEYDGKWIDYNAEGNKIYEYNYKKGKLDGNYKAFDNDGVLYYEYEYRKGDIIAYKFYDKSGAIIKEDKKRGGEFNYEGYSPYGQIDTEGLYDVSGGKTGEWKFSNDYGVVYQVSNYKENKLDGKYTTYHTNGEENVLAEYKNDSIIGYYKELYPNGQLESQGWYQDGMAQGEWRFYYSNGNIESINFYHKNKLSGEQKYFAPNGKLEHTAIFKNGVQQKMYYFSPTQDTLEVIDMVTPTGDYKIEYLHFNKKPMATKSYTNGVQHGKFKNFYYSGQLELEGAYLNGSKHGKWKAYYENGNLKEEYSFVNGREDGKHINYFEDGTIEEEKFYELDKLTGKSTSFYKNGKKKVVTNYSYDLLNGRKEFYSKNGTLQLVRFYNHGYLIGYTYLDKNGEELPMIPIKNGTAKIKAYYPNGHISKEINLQNGYFNGEYKSYFENGNIETEQMFTMGVYNGPTKTYFENGNLREEKNYLFGEYNGIYKTYYENGNLKQETNYIDDIKTGKSKKYKEDGSLAKEIEYFRDYVYKIKNL